MQTLQITITNPTGLHIRPGTELVRLVKTFECAIQIRKGDKTANAKSLVKLLTIGISQGDAIEITADGADEDKAIAAVRTFLEALQE